MKRIVFLLTLVVLSVFWSCSNLDMDIEQENITSENQIDIDPQLSLPYRLLVYDSDRFALKYMLSIYNELSIGRNLIKSLDIQEGGWIDFIWDQEIPIGTMGYAGRGYIFFNYIEDMGDDITEQLIFHELYHAYQHSGMLEERNLNDEIEAYLAQYLFGRERKFIFFCCF